MTSPATSSSIRSTTSPSPSSSSELDFSYQIPHFNGPAELEALIKGYQDSYYNGEAEISDADFDALWDELKRLKPDSPLLKKVGADSVDGFPKERHLIPMGSQEKAANPEGFLAWATKLALPEFVVQYKLDGASLELQYENGRLLKAITRGDGIIGDDITANALRMNGVIGKLDTDFSGGVRGEVVMLHDIWRSKHSQKANCRNAANGIMRRKDGDGCEDLSFIVYDAATPGDDTFFNDEISKISWLKDRGFTVTETGLFKTTQSVIEYRAKIAKIRPDLPFDIDGLVVKDPQTSMDDLRRERPQRQIAFKFELEQAISTLISVEWSESGALYTPIGIVEPVRLAGTTVKRANLCNPGMIREMGLKIGSRVIVVKRGEIIPKIEGLADQAVDKGDQSLLRKLEAQAPLAPPSLQPVGLALPPSPGAPPQAPTSQSLQSKLEAQAPLAPQTEIVIPTTCSCGTPLVDGDTHLYCPNENCPKRLLHRIKKWIEVLDIREIGEKLLIQLFEKGKVRDIADFYKLTAAELAEFERMGELSSEKVIKNLHAKRELSLESFVAGFDFYGIGEGFMERVVSTGYNTLEKLRNADSEQLAGVFGLGKITAQTLAAGLAETAAEMDAVLAAGIISIAPPPDINALPLIGRSFCFTGELKTMKRNDAVQKVKTLGGSIKAAIVKDLNYLVTNDTTSGSSKNKKAAALGIPIISEEDFLKLIQTG